MQKSLQSILTLSDQRIRFLREKSTTGFYQGSSTFIHGIRDELAEVEAEIESGKRVFLEDELGDVFWDYICLLDVLEQEGKISSKQKVFERCSLKFSERLNPDGSDNGQWQEVKKIQKARLQDEQNNHF